MKTLRILIYTDISEFNTAGGSRAGIEMQKFIKQKLEKIVEVKITVKSRHFDPEQTPPVPPSPPVRPLIRLTPELLADHDELWVFGFGNRDTNLHPEYGLDEDEIECLYDWMTTGGVMVTGDHSQPQDNNACVEGMDHNEFLARGSALGHRIPRARQMRVWKGPPTNCEVEPSELEKSDTQNTLEKVGSDEEDNLESDCFPQTLEGISSPPHFLFCYDLDSGGNPIPISRFPDHQHEGRVLIPEAYDECWPPRPPEPEFVAFGRDKRFTVNERVYPLVAAYDGDLAGVGRIVADTSFHHFIDINLRKLEGRDDAGNPKPDTPLDEVAQFHANLAYWLAPKSLRDEIKRDLLFRASIHLNVLETIGNGRSSLGRAMKTVLTTEVGAANLYRIFAADGGTAEQPLPEQLLTFVLAGEGAPALFGSLDDEQVLGSVVEAYHEFFAENGLDPLHLSEDPTPPTILFGGLERAFRAQFSTSEGLPERRADAPALGSSGDDQPGRKENEMDSNADNLTTTFLCGGEWKNSIVKSGGSIVEEGVFNLRVVDSGGKLEGTFRLKGTSVDVPIEGGSCSVNHMVIRRRDGRDLLVYEGDITDLGGDYFKIKGGTRRRNPTNFDESQSEGVADTATEAAFADDDWVAEKGTTFAKTGGE